MCDILSQVLVQCVLTIRIDIICTQKDDVNCKASLHCPFPETPARRLSDSGVDWAIASQRWSLGSTRGTQMKFTGTMVAVPHKSRNTITGTPHASSNPAAFLLNARGDLIHCFCLRASDTIVSKWGQEITTFKRLWARTSHGLRSQSWLHTC